MNSAFQWSDADCLDRHRLVKLCARLSGNSDAAEDLAQQTLLEAWLHEHNLRDPSRRDQWLNGVARNVCRRWARTRSRESWTILAPIEDTPGEDDVEMELERDELAELLDRALELLPVDARALLIAHYIEGLPQTEIARRLGVQPGTIAVRLHRGRFALRRVRSMPLAAGWATACRCCTGRRAAIWTGRSLTRLSSKCMLWLTVVMSRRQLRKLADRLVQSWLKAHHKAITTLGDSDRQAYLAYLSARVSARTLTHASRKLFFINTP